MSLINQALRKAQRDRNPSRMPQPEASNSTPGFNAPAQSGMKPELIIGLIALVAVLVGLVAGLSVVVLNKDSNTAAPVQLTTAPAPATSAPVTTAIAQTQSVPAPTLALAKPSPSELIAELREASDAAQKAAAAATAQKAKEAAKAAAEPSEAIYKWLREAKIMAVRVSSSGNKIILNGQTYAQGDIVNYELGLRCVIIQEGRVLFMDRNDKKYMKRP